VSRKPPRATRPPGAVTGTEKLRHLARIEANGENTVRTALRRPRVNARIAISFIRGAAADAPAPGAGVEGDYDVVFILGIPGLATHGQEIDFKTFMASGDSLLVFPPRYRNTGVTITSPDTGERVRVDLLPNDERRLAKAALRVRAHSFLSAERKAHDLVLPFLSSIAFRHDVALDVAGTQTTEVATGNVGFRFGVLGQRQVFTMDSGISTPVFRTVLAAYRDGLNASNPFHQVLSFWKADEGTRRIRALRRELPGADMRTPENERMPADVSDENVWDLLDAAALGPHVGKKFGDVQSAMQSAFRDAVAHLDPEPDVLLPDRFDDVIRAEHAARVLRHMARVMILNEMAADPVMSLRLPGRAPLI